jgi:hypothetical protein
MRGVRSADTSPEAHHLQMEVYRRMDPGHKVEIALEMSEFVFELAAAGVRVHHPDYDDDQVRWSVLRLRLGDDLYRRVWPEAPLVAP